MAEEHPVSPTVSRALKADTVEVRNIAPVVIYVTEDRALLVYRNHRDRNNEISRAALAFTTLLSLIGFALAGSPNQSPPLFPLESWVALWWIGVFVAGILTLWFSFRAWRGRGEREFIEALKTWSPSSTESSATTSTDTKSEAIQ